MSDILFIIAPRDFQDHEYEIPKKILESKGHNVITASSISGEAIGKFGAKVKVNFILDSIDLNAYKAVVFIGGPGAVQYQTNKSALDLAKEAFSSGKIVGAICIAPTILAYAGVLEGKKSACWNGDGEQKDVIESHGGHFAADDVCVDGLIVTANGPESAEKFGNLLVKVLG